MYIIHPAETSLGYYEFVEDLVKKYKAYVRLSRLKRKHDNEGKALAL